MYYVTMYYVTMYYVLCTCLFVFVFFSGVVAILYLQTIYHYYIYIYSLCISVNGISNAIVCTYSLCIRSLRLFDVAWDTKLEGPFLGFAGGQGISVRMESFDDWSGW